METTKPTEAPKAQAYTLAPRRPAPKVGMPKDGFWLLSGLAKQGKTTLSASIPDAVILELEKGGADYVNGWVQEIPDLATLRLAFVAAVKDPKVKAIVVDTLDVVLDWLADEVAEKYGLDSMTEKKEGVNGFEVWDALTRKVSILISSFKHCDKLVVALAHFKEPKLNKDGRLVITSAINAPTGKIGSYICSHADAIGICSKEKVGSKMQYKISFEGGGPIGAFGSRVPDLENKTITLPDTNQWAAIEALFKVPANGKTDKGGK